jgi:hypothetical protein
MDAWQSPGIERNGNEPRSAPCTSHTPIRHTAYAQRLCGAGQSLARRHSDELAPASFVVAAPAPASVALPASAAPPPAAVPAAPPRPPSAPSPAGLAPPNAPAPALPPTTSSRSRSELWPPQAHKKPHSSQSPRI